jgi:phosphoenolpyruvate---glycerone phosphotransferase subunit DhaL
LFNFKSESLVQSLQISDVKNIFRMLGEGFAEAKDLLTRLDSAMGDGDLGLTMTKCFFVAAKEAEKTEEQFPGKLFIRAGMAMARAAPSTMGTLLATGFMRGGKTVENMETLNLEGLSIFFDSFVRGIMERGKTAPGNKTIIDVLFPVTSSIQQGVKENKDLSRGIEDAYAAAKSGLIASTQMKARHGRAAYYQDASVGKQDGGATVGFLLVEGFYKGIKQIG